MCYCERLHGFEVGCGRLDSGIYVVTHRWLRIIFGYVALLLALTCQVHSAKAARPPLFSFFQPVTVVSNGETLCNAVAFSQIQSAPDFFLGRIRANNPSRCESALLLEPGLAGKGAQAALGVAPWTLGVFRMDWRKYRLEFVREAIDLPVRIGPNTTLINAYDPHTVTFGNETWVTFECYGKGVPIWSTCVAPLSGASGRVDVARLTVPVRSVVVAGAPRWYSASDPKLFSFGGSLYLYWTVVEITASSQRLDRTSARGMRLDQEAGGLRRLWGAGSMGASVSSLDPALTTEVLAPDPGDRSANTTVDIFDVRRWGDRTIVLAAVGGAGRRAGQARCATPLSANEGCYRLGFFEARRPLSRGGICRIYSGAIVPRNPVQYSRFVMRPDGTPAILADYIGPVIRNPGSYYLSAGFFMSGIQIVNLPRCK
jgi:hypothetical protein